MFVDKDISLFIRITIPATEAMPVPPLSATLGQSQINANEFCKQFNIRSAIYETGTLLSVHIFKFKNNSFSFSINRIFLPFLFYQIVEDDERTILLEKLYDIFLIYSRYSTTDVSMTSLASQFFGVIRSSKFVVLLFFY
jgi:hypothetical protein